MEAKPTFKAMHRFAPMSARKARPVADLVRGFMVNDALETLEFNHRRAASMLSKVIRSAIANAAQSEQGFEAKELRIAEVYIDEGPLKQKRLRYRPGPMGRAMPIRKRTCHISVVLGVGGASAAPTGRGAKPAAEAAPAEEKSED